MLLMFNNVFAPIKIFCCRHVLILWPKGHSQKNKKTDQPLSSKSPCKQASEHLVE